MASKGGKGKEKEKQVKSPPQVEQEKPPEREIIPGKITETQWCDWCDVDEGVEVVSDLVEEVTEIAFSIVYSHYLEEQAFPHSVDDAKHSLLKIIEWQFLSRDEGEVDTQHDPSWIEDEEPLPSSIDSWARGIVPQQSTTSLQTKISTAEPVHILPFIVSMSANTTEQQGQDVTDSQQEKQHRMSVQSETNTSITSSGRRLQSKPSPSQRPPRRARPQARRPEARMVVLEQPPIIDEAENEVDIRQQGEVAPSVVSSHTPISFTSEDPALLCRYPMPYGLKPAQLNWQREVTYDDRGNIIDMIKLDPAKFPSRRVKPVVKILAQSSTQHGQYGCSKASTRLQALRSDVFTKTSPATLRTHRQHTHAARPNKKPQIRGQRSRLVGVKTTPVVSGPSSDDFITTKESRRFPEMPALPPLIDTIDPVPGVTVREGGRIVCGAKRPQSLQPPTSPRSGMHLVRPLEPIKHSTTQDTLNSEQLLTLTSS